MAADVTPTKDGSGQMYAAVSNFNVKAIYEFKIRISARGGLVQTFPTTGTYKIRVDCFWSKADIIYNDVTPYDDPATG